MQHPKYTDIRYLTVLEQDQSRDTAHVETLRSFRIFINIDLGDGQLAFVLGSDFIQHGRNHLAGPAPLRPEIQQHRLA